MANSAPTLSGRALALLAAMAVQGALAQTPDPLAQASPCREAVQATLKKIDGATTGPGYARALADLDASITAFIKARDEDDESALHCLNAHGRALLTLAEHALGAEVYRRAHEIALKSYGPTDDSTLTLQGNLAVALTSLNRLDEAAALQEQVLAARENLADEPGAHKLAITLMNLAAVRSARGELKTAHALAERGWTIARRSMPDSDRRSGTMLHNYALVLDRVGLRAQAQRQLELALESRLESGQTGLALESLASLAASFFDVGRFEESDRRYRESVALAQAQLPPLHPLRGELERSWCRVLSIVGKAAEALTRCDAAIRLFAQRRMQLDLDRTKINRGMALHALGRTAEATQALRDAVQGLSTVLPRDHPEFLEAQRALSVTLVDQGQVDEGARLLESVLAAQTVALPADHPERLLTQGEHGVLLAIQGRLDEAEATLREYAAKTERTRADHGRDQRTSMGVFRRFASTRMFLAKLLVIKGRCADAFDWIENTKARALLDRIASRATPDAAVGADSDRVSALEQAQARLYVERALAAGDGAKQSGIDLRLRAIADDLAALMPAAATTASPSGAVSPSADLLAARLPSGVAALSVGLVDDEVLLVLYEPSQGFSCTTLESWNGLSDTVQALRALQSTHGGLPALMAGTGREVPKRIVRRAGRWFAVLPRSAALLADAIPIASAEELEAAVGGELFGWVLARATQVREMFVSSDGILNLIALDALKVSGQRVLDRLSLSHVPTFRRAAVVGKHRAFKQQMILLGDPVYSSRPGQGADRRLAATRAKQSLRGDPGQGNDWPPLPAAAAEVDSLTRAFKLTAGKSVFARQDASVPTLRKLNASGALSSTRFLVFAAHGLADLEEPELSSLVFSRRKEGSARDAYFTAAEFATLRLGTELVYFSACDTGYGQVVAGEGVLGLAAGALAAGSQATVHTLWSIDDATSAEFTAQFFGRLKSGVSPQAALRATKLAFARMGNRAGPAFWAPYVLLSRFGEYR